jgi:Tfp pilus assembly protein PilX
MTPCGTQLLLLVQATPASPTSPVRFFLAALQSSVSADGKPVCTRLEALPRLAAHAAHASRMTLASVTTRDEGNVAFVLGPRFLALVLLQEKTQAALTSFYTTPQLQVFGGGAAMLVCADACLVVLGGVGVVRVAFKRKQQRLAFKKQAEDMAMSSAAAAAADAKQQAMQQAMQQDDDDDEEEEETVVDTTLGGALRGALRLFCRGRIKLAQARLQRGAALFQNAGKQLDLTVVEQSTRIIDAWPFAGKEQQQQASQQKQQALSNRFRLKHRQFNQFIQFLIQCRIWPRCSYAAQHTLREHGEMLSAAVHLHAYLLVDGSNDASSAAWSAEYATVRARLMFAVMQRIVRERKDEHLLQQGLNVSDIFYARVSGIADVSKALNALAGTMYLSQASEGGTQAALLAKRAKSCARAL